MESIVAELVADGQIPKRSDIARLLASIASPGKKQDIKAQAVVDLFSRIGGGHNAQGIHVSEDLPTYEEY